MIGVMTVSFAAAEYASFGKRFERREDRAQIAKHDHVSVETQVMLRIDDARGRVHHRLAHWIQSRARLATHCGRFVFRDHALAPVSYTHLRAHETPEHLVC